MWRWRLAIAGLAVVAAAGGHAAAAAPPPIVIYVGPAQPDARLAATRDALRALAARRGTAFIDLSPEPAAPPQAALHLGRGLEAYVGFRYAEARTHVDRGLGEAAATGADGLDGTALSDLLIYRALAQIELGDDTGAWDDFVRAAVVDSARRLDPARFAPSVVAMFQRAVDSVQAAPTAQLSLALADDCVVHLDGRRIPPLDGALEVPRGEHYLRVQCVGYLPYGAKVHVLADQELKPALRAPATPDDAAIAAVARDRGATAVLLARVSKPPIAARTIALGLVESHAKTAHRGAVLALSAGAGAIVAAAERMLDAAADPALDLIAQPAGPAERAWYDRPWVWGAAGAAIAAALLLPLVVDDDAAASFDVRPGGDVPP